MTTMAAAKAAANGILAVKKHGSKEVNHFRKFTEKLRTKNSMIH